MSVGVRLREERERLGLSREVLAEKAGIHRNTLARYETDNTEVGAGFIETIRALGIDVDYVLFGIPNLDAPVDCPFARDQGFDLQYTFTLEKCREHAADKSFGSAIRRQWHDACQECLQNPITHGFPVTKSSVDIDGLLMTAIIESVETIQAKQGLTISPAKKARATVMLYRAFKASGKVDQKMIEEAVKLAAD